MSQISIHLSREPELIPMVSQIPVSLLVLPDTKMNERRLDALLFGQRREVDPARNPHPDICDLEIFHQRPVKQRTGQREADKLREVLKDMAKHLKLRLTSGCCEEDNSLPREDFHFARAITTPRLYNGKWQLRIFVSIEFLQPLLRNDLTPAER